jgi:hypothetical protein
MRIARKVFLLCAMALVAMALGASTASADSPIEVQTEAGVHCNPCVVTATGESHLNLFGGRVSTCEDTFTAEVFEDGTGHIAYVNENHHVTIPPPPTACTRIACNGVGEPQTERTFDITSAEETAPNQGQMLVDFCLDASSSPGGTGTHCTADVLVNDLGNHDYLFTLHDQCLGGAIEVEGEWTLTGGTPIEIVH